MYVYVYIYIYIYVCYATPPLSTTIQNKDICPQDDPKGGGISSSPRINLITNLDRPRIYSAAADAVLRSLKECVSIAQKWVSLVDNHVNLNLR